MREFHRSSSLLFKVFLKVVLMWGKRRDMTVRDRLPFNANHAVLAVAGGTINTASVGNRASLSRCSVISRPTISAPKVIADRAAATASKG